MVGVGTPVADGYEEATTSSLLIFIRAAAFTESLESG